MSFWWKIEGPVIPTIYLESLWKTLAINRQPIGKLGHLVGSQSPQEIIHSLSHSSSSIVDGRFISVKQVGQLSLLKSLQNMLVGPQLQELTTSFYTPARRWALTQSTPQIQHQPFFWTHLGGRKSPCSWTNRLWSPHRRSLLGPQLVWSSSHLKPGQCCCPSPFLRLI